MGEVIGRQQAVGVVVGKAVLLPGEAGSVYIGAPLHGSYVAVELRCCAIGGAFVVQRHVEKIGQLVAALQGTGSGIVDACKPATDVVSIIQALQVVEAGAERYRIYTIVIAGMQTFVCQAVEFIVHRSCRDDPAAGGYPGSGFYVVPGESQAARFVELAGHTLIRVISNMLHSELFFYQLVLYSNFFQ